MVLYNTVYEQNMYLAGFVHRVETVLECWKSG